MHACADKIAGKWVMRLKGCSISLCVLLQALAVSLCVCACMYFQGGAGGSCHHQSKKSLTTLDMAPADQLLDSCLPSET